MAVYVTTVIGAILLAYVAGLTYGKRIALQGPHECFAYQIVSKINDGNHYEIWLASNTFTINQLPKKK